MPCNQAVSNQILTVYQTQQPEIITASLFCSHDQPTPIILIARDHKLHLALIVVGLVGQAQLGGGVDLPPQQVCVAHMIN